MNWNSIAFDWNQARAFLATAETGSLTAAAKVLNMTQPTLSRQVAALEETLGVTLFERSGRAMTLTQSGADLVEHVRDMGLAASRFSLGASGHAQDVTGTISLSVVDVLAAYVLPDILADIRKIAPGVTFEVIVSNELSNLARREADIAIRHLPPTQSELIARRLPDCEAYLYGHRSYVGQRGGAEQLYESGKFELVGFGLPDQSERVLAERGIHIPAQLITSYSQNGVASWEMARRGLGLCIMMAEIAEIEPDMVRVHGDYPAIDVPTWLIAHRELRTSMRMRLVFDALAERLSARLRGKSVAN
ncbi:LysR family transcriptional regulator [Pontivivens insulae]|nr:LysR family transcriptional regulator [Pontivivens insulae]